MHDGWRTECAERAALCTEAAFSDQRHDDELQADERAAGTADDHVKAFPRRESSRRFMHMADYSPAAAIGCFVIISPGLGTARASGWPDESSARGKYEMAVYLRSADLMQCAEVGGTDDQFSDRVWTYFCAGFGGRYPIRPACHPRPGSAGTAA